MLGPLITQESIDHSPWYAKAIFYTMAYTYLAAEAIISGLNMLIAAIKRIRRRN